MRRGLLRGLLVLGAAWASASLATPADGHITVAAAADLHQALDDVVAAYRHEHPDSKIDVTYGSSGNLLTQIEQGAPFEIFFSADSSYPQQLVEHGKAGGTPVPYALGHLVMWSASIDMRGVQVVDLAEPRFGRIAIANPQHAPYGKRAEQALRAAGVWDKLQSRLVYGDNIAQTAQFAQSGNAQVGLVAESLVINSSVKGTSMPVPPSLYEPLKQSFVITRRGASNALAQDFARYVQGEQAKAILSHYGFNLPDDGAN
ncbi:molybdate ABC transporter substrate-binding protein [Dyella japonica]|uniref:Molybdate ABC transporter substrate-binding protein n=1 Tax=Dyella japonica A8 TaxID=1217721 RepID=A0A075K304_9GAMM|nr:molybdate ABC transporter substrate-binding protein [Dyella japonica]AIF48621.1 molybdate ABC transporter substrate-binding protein [Dyella japonica A8]